MRMDEIEQSRNIENRQRSSGRAGGAGVSLSTLIRFLPLIRRLLSTTAGRVALVAIVAAYYFMPQTATSSRLSSSHAATSTERRLNPFVSKVLYTTEAVWQKVFRNHGMDYHEPVLVLYRGYTHSPCGGASAQTGPFYCPADQKIYLDLGFFETLSYHLGAPGDFAQAYVLAHEVGHHVQKSMGLLDRVHRLKRANPTKANSLQVLVELQADCYAGIWGHYMEDYFKILEGGDLEEAIVAAESIGDDTLQKNAGQQVRPDAFTHGSSKQRVYWFNRGFRKGTLEACDTFKSLQK